MDWSDENTLYRILGHRESQSTPSSISPSRGIAERALERMASTTPNLPFISPIREEEEPQEEEQQQLQEQLVEAPLDFSDLADWGMPANLDDDQMLMDILNSVGRYDEQPEQQPDHQPQRPPPQPPEQQPEQLPRLEDEVVSTVADVDETNIDLKLLPSEDVSRMNQSELMEYFHNLRDYLNNTASDETTMQKIRDAIAFVRRRLIWRAPHARSYVRGGMDMNQLIMYLGELQRINQNDYSQASRDRINYTIDLVKNQMEVLRTQQTLPRNQDQNNASTSSGVRAGDESGDASDEPAGVGVETVRHRNMDANTESNAMRTRLGPRDHQTIANTTTVTTVATRSTSCSRKGAYQHHHSSI